MSHAAPPSPLRTWLSTLPVLLILAGSVLIWTSRQASGRMIQLGERIWPGYAADLRRDPDPVGVPSPTAAVDPGANADEALIGDILGEEAPPAAAPAPGAADEALIGDILGEEAAAPAAAPPAPGAADDALIADITGEAPAAPAPVVEAPATPRATLTPTISAFRAVDRSLDAFASWGASVYRQTLVLLLLLCGATATAARAHIGLVNARTAAEDRGVQIAQLLGNGLVAASCYALYQAQQDSGTEISDPYLPLMWAGAFVLMGLINVGHLARPLVPEPDAPPTSLVRMALSVPLYTSMAFIASVWFLLLEKYPAGLAVYLQNLTEHAELYLYVGLYVWTGMLLKRTRVASLGFDLLRPWKLPPELFAAVVVPLAALPTAYSGASGIFVIAVGGLIYQEMRAAGARPQLALATTAMSGSLGVVLRPCLLPVIVAYLNPVTTDVLYDWGRWVFVLTAVLFALVLIVTRQSPLSVAPVREALPEMGKRMKPLGRYVFVAVVVLGLCYLLLDQTLDEHTAPTLLPLVLFGFLFVERGARALTPPATPPVREATDETTGHIGALLLLMSLSIALGGAIERSEIILMMPSDLGSPFLTMGLLVVVLIIIGMTMDPYGAVIVVSATIADVAYKNGIDVSHFWLTVLTAFELGYLSPPVALNQLLTRQVVGGAEVDRVMAQATGSWWRRNEATLLPVTVMGIALLIVAFVPLFFTAA